MVIILLSTKMFLCQIYKDTYILWYRSGEGDFFRNMNSPCGCFPANFVAGKLSCSVWAKKLAGTTMTFKWVTYWNAFPIEKKKVKKNCNLNSRGWFMIWTLVADLWFWTLVADLWFWTLVADLWFWTLVAHVRFWTLAADLWFWPLMAHVRFWTLAADFWFWTVVGDL